MSYYDFAHQKSKPKKSRHLLLWIVVAVVAAATLWLLPHHRKPQHTLARQVITPSHIVQASKVLKLPAAPSLKTTKPAKSIAHVTQPTAVPKLEFYEMLKSPQASATSQSGQQRYNLQVAALASPAAAQQVVAALKRQSFSAHIVTNSNGGATHWNRVILGPYNTAADARSVQKRLENLGQPGVLLISGKK
jgi:cell division protein FtsN